MGLNIFKMKLCLGTAQFGLDYGINNTGGKIPKEDVIKILNLAHDNGIIILDTASAYGNSEAVLGEGINQTGKKFQVITKFPVNTELRPLQWIDTSLGLLKEKKIYGYLFHNYSTFKDHPDYIEDFIRIKENGKTEKIGFSLYHPYEAEYILKNNIPCDIIQLPYNILDQRFAYLFSELSNKEVEIYVRSVFLQGLFFIDPNKLDSHFDSVRDLLREIHQFAKDYSVNIAVLCLGFVYAQKDVANIVIGIDSLDNLRENISNYTLLESITVPYNLLKKLAVNDENIILPYNWSNKNLA
jgi:aryl-alcohol dehydrogenase-like predicted oxidoreductase